MTSTMTWLAVLATVAVLAGYEVALALAQRRSPERLARTAHATLRQEWSEEVSKQKGSEILAVQTLRNSLMSATMTASTAVRA
jgi:HAMP domain-containing protein